jgi:hypothetical protein
MKAWEEVKTKERCRCTKSEKAKDVGYVDEKNAIAE